MNVLESPLEALAFNYVSFGFFALVNNLWTWIAFVTAAVSFWRIRVAGGGAFPTEESPPLEGRSSNNGLSPPPEEKPSPIPSPPEEKSEEASVPTRFVEDFSATRGSRKFALYFVDNGGDGDLTAVEECDAGVLTATEEESEWFECWERALRTRCGESETAGWYRYLDLTELNGNVVSLWDGRYNSSVECPLKRFVLW